VRVALALAILAVTGPGGLRAQTPPQTAGSGRSDPAASLADALAAACRQDASSFASHLTAKNAAAFRELPEGQRTALLKRFVLLEDPGKPLLSTSAEGHPVMRCEAGGVVSEMRFGGTESADNLAFIPVEVPQAPTEASSVRFGLVREAGEWKILSVGLLLLDVPALAQQWAEDQLSGDESEAVASLDKIAAALEAYRNAYGKLPEALDQLAPAGSDGASPERAGLLDKDLASGQTANYQFRYIIIPTGDPTDDSKPSGTSGFALAATPVNYGKTGRLSFFVDSAGALHGADKHGVVATATDPPLSETSR
jgi:hypothetical protein